MHYFTEEEKIEKGLSELAIASFESPEEVANESSIRYKGQHYLKNYWYLKFPFNNTTGLPNIFGEPSIIYGYIGSRGIIKWYKLSSELKQTADYFEVSVILKDPTVETNIVIKCLPVLKEKIRYNLMVLAGLKEDLIFDIITRDGKYINVLCHRKRKERNKLTYICKS